MRIMREIERLYTSLISWGPHKFKDGFNLADKDERMRKGGKGEMGETSYIAIIPMVFWRVVPRGSAYVWGEEQGELGPTRAAGGLPWKAQSSHVGLSSARTRPPSFAGSTLSLSITPPLARGSPAQEAGG